MSTSLGCNDGECVSPALRALVLFNLDSTNHCCQNNIIPFNQVHKFIVSLFNCSKFDSFKHADITGIHCVTTAFNDNKTILVTSNSYFHKRVTQVTQINQGILWQNNGTSLQWRHNEHYGVSNHRGLVCLLKRLFRHTSKKTSKLHVTGLCGWNRKYFHLMTSSCIVGYGKGYQNYGDPILKNGRRRIQTSRTLVSDLAINIINFIALANYSNFGSPKYTKKLLHPGMMSLFCDYFYFISPRGLRTGCLA